MDSMPYHVKAWQLYLERQGRDAAALLERMHGKHNDELVRDAFGPELPLSIVKQMGAEKEALYRDLIRTELDRQLIPGVRDFLERVSNWPKAVASNAEAANVSFVLDEAKLRPYFLHALDGGMVRRGKPDPEIYLLAAAKLGKDPGECIVFEDSQTGIDAALAAGMTVVAINSHRTELKGPRWEFPDFREGGIGTWLEQLLASSSH